MYLDKKTNNKILLDKLNKNKHFIEVIKPIIDYSKFTEFLGKSSYPALALSGGSLTSIWNDTEVNDWDLYLVDFSLSVSPASRAFTLSLLINFIAKNYPSSKIKIHSSSSDSDNKVDTYLISDFISKDTALKYSGLISPLKYCGLISIEVILDNLESLNIQLIVLNFKSFKSIFPPEKPVDYFVSNYNFINEDLTEQADNTSINSNFISFNYKTNSINLLNDEKIDINDTGDGSFFPFFMYFLSKVSSSEGLWNSITTVSRFLLSPYSLIETYDFTCVAAYYYNDEVDCLDGFYSDNESKTLVINPYHSNILNFHARVKKYSDRGYFIDSNLLFQTLEKQHKLLSGDFQSYAQCSIIPISYYRKLKFTEEVKSIIDNFDSFQVNKKMEYFSI